MTFVRRWLAVMRVVFGVGTRRDVATVLGLHPAEYDNLLVAMGAAWTGTPQTELVVALRVYAGVEMTRALEALDPDPDQCDIRHARRAAQLADEIARRIKQPRAGVPR